MIIIFYIGSWKNCLRLVGGGGGPGDQKFSAFYEPLHHLKMNVFSFKLLSNMSVMAVFINAQCL